MQPKIAFAGRISSSDAVRLRYVLRRMLEALDSGMMPHLTFVEADLIRPMLPDGWMAGPRISA